MESPWACVVHPPRSATPYRADSGDGTRLPAAKDCGHWLEDRAPGTGLGDPPGGWLEPFRTLALTSEGGVVLRGLSLEAA
jgi:hypothetical protein